MYLIDMEASHCYMSFFVCFASLVFGQNFRGGEECEFFHIIGRRVVRGDELPVLPPRRRTLCDNVSGNADGDETVLPVLPPRRRIGGDNGGISFEVEKRSGSCSNKIIS